MQLREPPANNRNLWTNDLKSVIRILTEANCPEVIKEFGPKIRLQNPKQNQQWGTNTMYDILIPFKYEEKKKLYVWRRPKFDFLPVLQRI